MISASYMSRLVFPCRTSPHLQSSTVIHQFRFHLQQPQLVINLMKILICIFATNVAIQQRLPKPGIIIAGTNTNYDFHQVVGQLGLLQMEPDMMDPC